MGLLIRTALLVLVSSSNLYAQSDWNTYPARSISEIVQAHSGTEYKKSDIIISADPFPSKTIAAYTGRHRPVSEYAKFFIKLWVQSRNVPPENVDMLVEEYLFKEGEKEYWIPVVKQLAPFFDKELKEGDEITIYYFFLGGYNEKTLSEKEAKRDKTKKRPVGTVEDKMTWMFAVEEFQK